MEPSVRVYEYGFMSIVGFVVCATRQPYVNLIDASRLKTSEFLSIFVGENGDAYLIGQGRHEHYPTLDAALMVLAMERAP